jgi:hypothetical protein
MPLGRCRLTSGELKFRQGAPVIAVGALVLSPRMTITVRASGPIRKTDRGKTVPPQHHAEVPFFSLPMPPMAFT